MQRLGYAQLAGMPADASFGNARAWLGSASCAFRLGA
jgi:hypothetical protein